MVGFWFLRKDIKAKKWFLLLWCPPLQPLCTCIVHIRFANRCAIQRKGLDRRVWFWSANCVLSAPARVPAHLYLALHPPTYLTTFVCTRISALLSEPGYCATHCSFMWKSAPTERGTRGRTTSLLAVGLDGSHRWKLKQMLRFQTLFCGLHCYLRCFNSICWCTTTRRFPT